MSSHKMQQSSRARSVGGNRGGVGGGYERTNPDYDADRIRRMRAEYDSLAGTGWQETYLEKLSKWDRLRILNRNIEIE